MVKGRLGFVLIISIYFQTLFKKILHNFKETLDTKWYNNL